MTPSKQQQAILDEVQNGNGNILVKALAGTGKTILIMMCLPYVEGDVFVGAFNVSIKQELERRIASMRLPNCNIDVKTIHGAGLGAYKYGGGSRTTRTEKDKVHFIVDELGNDVEDYVTYRNFICKLVGIGKRAGIGPLVPNTPDSWQELIDYYSVDDELPDRNGDREDLIERLISYTRNVFRLSLDKCKEEIDFDDMLLAPIHFNCRFKKYDWVFCDEVQDNSAIRQEITIRMVKSGGRMLAVGDENQSIYGFCGANHEAMSDLQERMDMTVFPLSVTYRCPKLIVELARQWVPDYEASDKNPEGTIRTAYLDPEPCAVCYGSGFRTVGAESVICAQCGGSGKIGPDFWDEIGTLNADCVIMCRNNRPVVELAYRLLRAGVACQIEGRDFAGSLIKLCQKWKVRELNALESRLTEYKTREAAKWRAKRNEERAVGIEDKIDTLLTLLDAVRASGKSRVSDLTDRINTMFGDTEAGQRPRVLTLSSCHKMKGREFKRVYILGRDRYMPSRWAKQPHEIKQENNLQYVAVTRAMQELVDVVVPPEPKRRDR